jgi:hypothetical protein
MIRPLRGEGLPAWSLNAGTLRAKPERPSKLLEIDLRRARASIHARVDGTWTRAESVDLVSVLPRERSRSKTLKIQDS